MELELGLKLLLQGLPTIAKIFIALQEERLRQLKQQKAKVSQKKLKSPVHWIVPQENQEFQAWRFEQEKSLQQQLAAYNRETQLNIAAYQRETALQLPESHKILDHWPLRLFPSQLLGSHHNTQQIPLRIFLSPPQVQSARLSEVEQALPEIEQQLAQSLGEFLHQNYPLTSQERPTEFLAGAWENQRFHREASIKTLFEMLKSEPTLILESELVGDELTFRFAYWGLGHKTYCYHTIISRLNYKNLIYNSAKQRALKWKKIAQKLLESGESAEDIRELGEDKIYNLELLEKEEKWQQIGIDTSELALNYKIKTKDFESLSQLLITCHCLVAGWVADAHHLVQYDVSPLLPELLPQLLENTTNQQFIEIVMQTTISGYKDIFNALELERPLWIPELALKLAKSLTKLPNKSWAKEQLDYSFQAWLRQHQLSRSQEPHDLVLVPSTLSIEDKNYLEALKECIAIFGDEQGITQVNELLSATDDLNSQSRREKISLVQLGEETAIAQLDSYRNGNGRLQRQPLLANVSLLHTLTGYSGKAASIAVSVDGQTIASGSDDNTIKLWQLQTGELIHTLTGNSGRVLTLTLSPDGRTLASSHKTSDRSCINIWKLETGELLSTLTGHHKWIYSLVFSPDGQTLISGGYKIKLWDLNTGTSLCTLAGHKKWVYCLAISPDGKTLVSSGGDKTIKIWHLSTGELVKTLAEHSDWVRTIAISPDGQFLASGSDDNTIKLWCLSTGKLIRTFTGHSDWVLSLAISPDGQTLISGSRDHTIKLWHLETGKLLCTLTGHQKWVYSLAVSPDGQILASGSEDKTIKIWRAI